MVATNKSSQPLRKPNNGFDFITPEDVIGLCSDSCSKCANEPSRTGSVVTHCPFPERHKNGDANPSLIVWFDTGRDKFGRTITDGRANMECAACNTRPIELIDRIRKQMGRSPIYAG